MTGNPSEAVARIDFATGELRGTHLTLHAGCLVHRGEAELETLPLASLASVRVAFARNYRYLGWGGVLVVAALVLSLLAEPLARLGGLAAAEFANGSTGIAGLLQTVFRVLEGLARLFPVIAGLMALAGVALAVLGWMGSTMLTVAFAGQEREYATRGRNARLLDFAELLAEQLINTPR